MDIQEREIQLNLGTLKLSSEEFFFDCSKGDTIRGELIIEDTEGRSVEGYIASSSGRLILDKELFNEDKAVIGFTFSTDGLGSGDTHRCRISIISNRGEREVPVRVSIAQEAYDSSIGSVKNLFHFTNLAKSSWDEAAEIFGQDSFINLLTGADAKYKNLYVGLSRQGNKNYNLEEFLIGIGKKELTIFSTPEAPVKVVDPVGHQICSVPITREGWGYTLLAVKAEGDFIELATNRIEDADFKNNVCNFNFAIDETKLHAGNNYGRITFRHMYGQSSVEVVAKVSAPGRRSLISRKNKTTLTTLTSLYLDYVTGKITRNKWLQQTEPILSRRIGKVSEDLSSNLMLVHMLIEGERYSEAKWILDNRIEGRMENAPDELYCYYLFILCRYTVDEYYSRDVAEKIKGIFDKNQDNWRIAWILLQISPDMKRDPYSKLQFAVKQIENGCLSPVMYVEIVKILNDNPSLLTNLEGSVVHALVYGARKGLMTPELERQVAIQSSRLKDFDPSVLRLLINNYDNSSMSDTLQAICIALMRGNKVGPEYLKWYRMGVEKSFTINGLYESFIVSLDKSEDAVIPKQVLMYFAYQNDLPIGHKAYLYAYVHRNKDYYPDIYNNYKGTLERFVLNQLYSGNVSRELAYLYTEVILTSMATEDNLRQFAKLILIHCIKVSDANISKVIIIDDRVKEEFQYPVTNGEAYVTLPSNKYTLLLEDLMGNRFLSTKEHITERFFSPRKLLPIIEQVADDSLELDLYICEGNMDYITINERNVSRFAYLERSKEITDAYKSSIRLPLIRFLRDIDDTVRLDDCLSVYNNNNIAYADRDEVLRLFCLRDMYDKAYEYVLHYGPECIDPQILVSMCTKLLKGNEDTFDSDLYLTILNAFERGKYNDPLLRYLAKFHSGTMNRQLSIWKAASNFMINTADLCERMLKQTIYTRTFLPEESLVFRNYVENGCDREFELVYLEDLCHDNFVSGRVVDDFVYEEIDNLYEDGESLAPAIMLSYLREYSRHDNINNLPEVIKNHIRSFIHILITDGKITMPFFKAFKSISIEAQSLSSQVMIEYQGKEDSKVIVNYCIHRDGEEDDASAYTREEMRNMYGGIFVKTFLLFYGESLQYYITENGVEGAKVSESGALNSVEIKAQDDSDRFAKVNDIAISIADKDYETARRLLEEYKYREYLVDNMFTLQ